MTPPRALSRANLFQPPTLFATTAAATDLRGLTRQELRHRNRVLHELAPGNDISVKRRVGVHLNLAELDVLHHVPVPRRVAERLARNNVTRVVRHVDVHL